VIVGTSPQPNLIASKLTGRDYVSWSAISTYRTCPLRYKFRYVDGLPEPTVSAALVFGSGIHRAIERHFRELFAGSAPPALEDLLAEFQAEWQSRPPEQVRFGKEEDAASLARLAERTLTAFQQNDVARPAGRLLGVEEELRGPVVPGCPDLLGRVDLIVDTDEALVISDWKTARSRWSADQAEGASEQLLLYAELARDLAPGKPVRLEFVILTKTKDVAVDRHALWVDPRKARRTKRVVEHVWRAIEAGHFYPAPSAMNCPGCPFRGQCRAWAG